MCGLCGIASSDPSFAVAPDLLHAMTDSIAHRGPDDSGAYFGEGVALGSRRLAILDLSLRGHMPMHTPDGRYHIVYNGEVYNYRELRARLEARGRALVSETDTEAILLLYAEEGPAMLDHLNGMFAIAIWDSRERTLFIARDRLGIKPLCYAHDAGGRFVFASEEKALLTAGIAPEFDPDTWEELIYFRYVAGERSPYRHIRRLLPGHYLVWKDGAITTHRYWNLSERAAALRESADRPPIGAAESAAWFRAFFDESIAYQRISDVPVGVLLSGGLDSSSVAAAAADQVAYENAGSAAGHTGSVASFTVRFSEPGYDEGPIAAEVAARWNLNAHTLTVPLDQALLPLFREALALNDEPLPHGNEPHILGIARYSKPHVTVLLSGEGADEVLGGYVRYTPLRYLSTWGGLAGAAGALLGRFNHRRLHKLRRYLSLGSPDRLVLFNAADVYPTDLAPLGAPAAPRFAYREQVLAEAQALYPRDWARQAMYSDQHTFLHSVLHRVDRMTMGASIEARVPFLDHRLVEAVAALPSSTVLNGRRGKRLLREAAPDRLPASVLNGRKWGFGVPWHRYFREQADLRRVVAALPADPLLDDCPLPRAGVAHLVDRFLNHGDDAVFAVVRQLALVSLWRAGLGTRRA
jgi:asparagine synthase (glutamine-hydrolysing)